MKRQLRKRMLSMIMSAVMLAGITSGFMGIIPQHTASAEKTDALGIDISKVMSEEEKSNLKNNPYGTTGWVNLSPKTELVETVTVKGENSRKQRIFRFDKNADGGKFMIDSGHLDVVIDNQVTYPEKSTTLSGGGHSLAATVAGDFDGVGRNELVAHLVFHDDDKNLCIYLTDGDGKIKVDKTEVAKNRGFLHHVNSKHATSHMAMAAGDFDGDGRDSIIIYNPYLIDDSDNGILEEWEYRDGKLKEVRTIDYAYNLMGDDGKLYFQLLAGEHTNKSNKDYLRSIPSLSLDAEDTDRDGRDELMVVANWNDLPHDKYGDYEADWQCSYFSVYDYNDKWDRTVREVLEKEGKPSASGRLRFAGVTTGNFYQSKSANGVDYPEIMVGGFIDEASDDGCDIESKNLGLYGYKYTEDSEGKGSYVRIIADEQHEHNKVTKKNLSNDDKILDPLCVKGFAPYGIGYEEMLFIEGEVYEPDLTNMKFNPKYKSALYERELYTESVFHNVQSAVAGNFNGNMEGREQLYFTTYRETGGTYTYSVIAYYSHYNDNQKENTFGYQTNEYSVNKKECVVTLAAADLGTQDGTMIKIKEKNLTYSEPEVMAILEAPPIFNELKYPGGDNNGRTDYGIIDSAGSGTSSSTSITANTVIGYEYTDPITVSGFGYEATMTHDWTDETVEMSEREVEVVYYNDSGKNLVIVFRTPITVYTYEYRDYANNPDADNTGDKIPTMNIGIQGEPVTNMITVEEYNKAADMYNLYRIKEGNTRYDGADLATPGLPESYRDTLPDPTNPHSWTVDDKYITKYSGSGTVSQSVTDAMSTENSSTYHFDLSVVAYGRAFGTKFGGGVGKGFGDGTITVESSAVRKYGSVSARPKTFKNYENYDFNWRFATWTIDMTKPNGNENQIKEEIPVLGYIVTDVEAPPSTGENVTLTDYTTNSMVLSWDGGSRPAEYYQIYRYDPEGVMEYVPVATVSGGNKVGEAYEHKLENLTPNTTYRYVVSAFGDGLESVISDVAVGRTLSRESAVVKFENPSDYGTYDGGKGVFSVKVTDWGGYDSISYQWQQKTRFGKWENVGENSPKLTVDATRDMDGMQYRCVISGHTPDASIIPFYSDAATLSVGKVLVEPVVEVSPRETDTYWDSEATGAIDNPYKGHIAQEIRETKTEYHTGDAYLDITYDGKTYTGPVYEVEAEKANSADKEKLYLARAWVPDGYLYAQADKTYDEGAKGDRYSVKTGTEKVAVLTHDYEDREYGPYPNSEKALEVVHKLQWDVSFSIYTNDKMELYKRNSSKMYYPYTVSETSVGDEVTDAEVIDGLKYIVYGIDSINNSIVAENTEDGMFYELHKEADGSVTKKRVEPIAAAEYKVDGYKPITDSSVFAEENHVHGISEYTSTYTTTNPGTTLNIMPKTMFENDYYGNYDCTLVITNLTSGERVKYTGKSNSLKQVWSPAEAGVYSIKAEFTDMQSPAYYYLASNPNDDSPMYAMEAMDGEDNFRESFTYGERINLFVKDYSGKGYKVPEIARVSFNGEDFSSLSIFPGKAGEGIAKAYDKDNKLIAATYIKVNKKHLTVFPYWEGKESNEPVPRDEILIKADELVENELPDIFDVTCDLYDADGNIISGKSGAFKVNVGYDSRADDKLLGEFNAKYDVVLEDAEILVKAGAKKIKYQAGENGEIDARFSDYFRIFMSGTSLIEGEALKFTAIPNTGYSVDEWFINDVPATEFESEQGKNIVSVSGNTMNIDNFEGDLNIRVTFKNDSFKVDYEVTDAKHGTVSAKDSFDNAVASGAGVSEGAEVTFTAVPEVGFVVESWTVNGSVYTWDNSEALYRENSLTLKGISEDKSVAVKFKQGAEHKLTAEVYAATEGVSVDGIIINAKDMASGTEVDLNNVRDGEAIIFTVPVDDNLSVKEWQVDEGSGYVTQLNSGGMTSFTLYNITKDIKVRAVIATAQVYTLSYKAEAPAEANVVIKAYHNEAEIQNGVAAPAYISIEFEVTGLAEAYYVAEWSDNVEVNSDNNKKATLKSLDGDTSVTVRIGQKPMAEVVSSDGGETIASAQNEGVEITIASGEKSYIDYGSTVKVSAMPADGYYVKSVSVGDENLFTESELNYEQANAGVEIEVNEVTQDSEISVVYAKKPVITFGGTDKDVQVTAKQGENNLISGEYVEKYSDDIMFIAEPICSIDNLGNVTSVWTVNGLEVTSEAAAEELNDNTQYTVSGKINEDITVVVATEKLSQYTIDMSAEEIEEGKNYGSLIANITRKALESYSRPGITESGAFYDGSDITVIAQPENGYKVQTWTVNGEQLKTTRNTIEYKKANSDLDINVRFIKMAQGITFGVDATEEGGYISEATAAGVSVIDNGETGVQLSEGIAITLTAVTNKEYELKHWTKNGEIIRGSEGLSQIIYESQSQEDAVYISPVFEKVKYEVKLIAENGEVTASPEIKGFAMIGSGTAVKLTANPNKGYTFGYWKVNGRTLDEEANVLSLVIEENTEVEAIFEAEGVVVSFTADRGAKLYGEVDGRSFKSGDTIPYNSTIELRAVPENTDVVESWWINGTEDTASKMSDTADAPLTYKVENVTDALTIHARVIEKPVYTITLKDKLAGGEISFKNNADNKSLQVERGASVTVEAKAKPYWLFKSWNIDGEIQRETAAELKIDNIRRSAEVGAEFYSAISYPVNLTVASDSGDKVSVSVNNTTIYPGSDASSAVSVSGGETVVFKAIPSNGKMIKTWWINGVEVTNETVAELGAVMSDGVVSNILTIDSLTESLHVMAEFEDITLFKIPASVDGEYTVENIVKVPSDIGGADEIRKGGGIAFKLVPTAGKVIASLAIGNYTDAKIAYNNDGSAVVTIDRVDKDIDVNATTAAGIPLTINCGTNGKLIVKLGDVQLASGHMLKTGDIIEITATADNDYKFDGIKVNGKTVANGDKYTVSDENELLVEASFKKTGGSGGGGRPSSSGGGGGGGYSGGGSYTPPQEAEKNMLFEDVKEADWFYEVVKKAYEDGLMNGVSDTLFAPNDNITRGMFVTILHRAEGEPNAQRSEFTDVPADEYYTKAVDWAYENGIVLGVSADKFAPDDYITREQIAALMIRYAKYKNIAPVGAWAIRLDYADVAEVSDYAAEGVMYCKLKGIMEGKENNIFAPQDNTTRAEAAAVLTRFLEQNK